MEVDVVKTTSENVYEGMPCPANYRCRNCGRTGLALLRDPKSDEVVLKCPDCLRQWEGLSHAWIPAVPEDSSGLRYLALTSISVEGMNWFNRLPYSP